MADERTTTPEVEGKPLMAWVSETLQAAGAVEEDPVCGLLVECCLIARGEQPHRDRLPALIQWATRHYAATLSAPRTDHPSEEGE